jgi:hypothetical protein
LNATRRRRANARADPGAGVTHAWAVAVAIIFWVVMTTTAVFRTRRGESWLQDDSFLARNDPLRWYVRRRLARGDSPPSRSALFRVGAAQIAFATLVLIGLLLAQS